VTLVESFGPAQEAAWREGERQTVAAMGTINLATAALVRTIATLDATEGWRGHGIRSLEHWVQWKAGISERRARDLVTIAQRIEELPRCWSLFAEGRITEDTMARLARRLPAARDAELAGLVPGLMVSQLGRILRTCPEQPNRRVDPTPRPEPERFVGSHTDRDGWLRGTFCLPPSEGAELETALGIARDQEFREANGLDDDADVNASSRAAVTAADGFMRLVREGCDALDRTLQRTGHRGERCQVVLHHEVGADGALGPGQLHLGDVIPDTVARFLACDAEIRVMAWRAGRLLGINPTERTVPRRLRRAIERRDQGCLHPLCSRRRHLHIHHLQHWAEGGLTVPVNLLCLCTLHHRELHEGLFSIEGDPEAGPLRFFDARGRPIEPPDPGSPGPLRLVEPSPFTQPHGGRLATGSFSWN
jgi:hypothetical protein